MPIRQILPRKVDVVDEVERWKIRWALVDDNARDSTLHMQQIVTYTRLYRAVSVTYCQCWCHLQQAKHLSVQSYLKSTIGDE